jgi:hypothetical protein
MVIQALAIADRINDVSDIVAVCNRTFIVVVGENREELGI